MEASGIALWACWQGTADPAVGQAMQDYGGMRLAEDSGQDLWFFFTSDVLLAMARLETWGKFNSQDLALQAIPARVRIGQGSRDITLKLDSALAQQTIAPEKGVRVLVHPRIIEEIVGVPGLTFPPAPEVPGAARLGWLGIVADARMPLQPFLSWFFLLKPLGNPLDKGFQTGWREFFGEIENILQRHKLKYILSDNFLIFPLDSLRMMRDWCRELLQLIGQLREERPEHYWPCVSAVVERKKLNFNNELPKKIPLDWDQLVPDLPYMSFRSGYLLGEGFQVYDAGLSAGESTLEDWCTAGLVSADARKRGMLPVTLASRVIRGAFGHCFYCGMRNHQPIQCPTKNFETLTPSAWRDLAVLDFDGMNQGLRAVEAGVRASDMEFLEQAPKLEGQGGIVLRAMFEINSNVQYRMTRRIWLSRGREYPRGLDEMMQKDDSPVWDVLDHLRSTELHAQEKETNALIARYPRDYRPRSLSGFIALERGDPARAYQQWKETQSYCATPLQQGFHVMLQARAQEVLGRYQQAGDLYTEVLRLCPLWHNAAYRRAVCLVKQGFAEQAGSRFLQLIDLEPSMFNRILIDPEMERGALHMLSALHDPWSEAEQRLEDDRRRLAGLRTDLAAWFPEDSEFAKQTNERIERLLQLSEVRNYVPFQAIIQGRQSLEKEIQTQINQDARELKNRFTAYMNRLKYIRDEAAWFPFPSILIEFNKAYNKAAANLNWALTNQFITPEAFKQANLLAESEAERIQSLERRLKFLRIVRDFTLFVLILGRTFLWMEIVFLVLVLVVMPLGTYYGEKMGLSWLAAFAGANKWQVQKVVLFVLSMGALAFSTLRTLMVFEKKRNKLFEKAQGKEKKK